MSFLGLLGLVFIVLKLMSVITWSWWFVLMPLYFWPIIIFISVMWFGIKVTKKRL